MSGTDPDAGRNRPIDRTQAYRPGEAAPEPPAENLPKIPGITLHHEIARGGMGVVYSGRQDFLDRRVAVKLLSVELGGESFVQRFQREAKILAGIKHPNIVACHMAGQTDDGQSYLVMEFIDGPSLKSWIADHGVVPIKAALRTTRAVAQALGHAHLLGIIHRDVKPENILLETVTSTALDVTFPFTPKVVDLGLARSASGAASMGLTSPGSVMGTPATMSPEQYDEPDSVDFRSDIYGLGCALYEMLVGMPAFRGKKLSDIVTAKRAPSPPDPCRDNPEVPAAVGALVQSMLATNREDRPRSYKELDEQLVALMDTMASTSPRVTRAPVVGEETETTFRRPGAAAEDPTVVGRDKTKPPAPGKKGAGPGILGTAEINFLTEGLEAKGGQPGSSPFQTLPPSAGAKPPAKEGTGPGLLRTAEINFLAEGLEAKAQSPAADEAFRTRISGGASGGAGAATPPAPSGAHQAPAAGPVLATSGKAKGGVIAAALGVLALGGVAWFVLQPGSDVVAPKPDPKVDPRIDPKPQPLANVPPVVTLEGSQTEVEWKKLFTVEAKVRDADGDKPSYNWIVPDEIRQTAGRGEAKATFQVLDGLPKVEFPITLEVTDGKNKPVTSVHTVKLGDMPPARPLAGYKDGSAWRFEKSDAKWNRSTDASASCKAGTSRESMQMDLGSDTYWEWTGFLQSEVDEPDRKGDEPAGEGGEPTAPAVVGVRFEFGDRAFGVECTRKGKGDDAPWSVRMTRATFANGVWTLEPASAETTHEWTPDPNNPDEPMAWFSVQRRGKELCVAIGEAVLPVDKKVEVHESRLTKVETLDPSMPDPKVTLYVDQGIGRFLRFVSR